MVTNPRWITALAALPYSDLFASGECLYHPFAAVIQTSTGSWDGFIRLWRLNSNLKSFEAIGDVIPVGGVINSLQLVQVPTSAIANARWYQANGGDANGVPAPVNENSSNRSVGSGKGILVVAAVGREPRMGRWLRLDESEIVRNCALVIPLEIGS